MANSQNVLKENSKTINKRHLNSVARRFLFCTGCLIVSVCLGIVMFSAMYGTNIDVGGIGTVGSYVARAGETIYRTIDVAANNVCLITNYFDDSGNQFSQPVIYQRYWRLAYQSEYAGKVDSFYGYKVSPFIFTVNIIKDDGESGTIETLFFDKTSPTLYSRPRDNEESFKQITYTKES